MSAEPAPAPRPAVRAGDLEPEALAAFVLVALAFVAYWLTGPTDAGGDSHAYLADAFLHGRMSIFPDLPQFELVPVPGGGGAQYSPFPPVPAVTYLPLVAFFNAFGEGVRAVPQNLMSAVVGTLNVWLAWRLLGRIGVAFGPRQVLTIAFAFTTHWWVAGMAGTHHYGQVVATGFLLVALILAVDRRAPILAGLALPLLLYLYADRWRPTRAHALLLLGVAMPAVLIGWYNLARFGSPLDFGYAHIPSGEDGLVTDEPWFRHGLLSIAYIPRHLYAIFLQSFGYNDGFPWLVPLTTGLSLTLSAPWVFWAVRARGAAAAAAGVAVALVMLPDVTHGSWGFAQFGYRFILDAVPILLLLLGWAYRERVSAGLLGAVALGVAVHAYGITVWNLFEIVR